MRLHERKTAEYHAKVEAAKAAKKQQWADIQEHAPNLAKALLELKGTFGKVKLTDLELHEHKAQSRKR